MATHPITELRRLRQLSQEELARRAGVTRTLLSSVETGRATPSVAAALALARALDTTVEALFGPPETSAAPAWAWAPQGETSRYWEVRNPEGTLRYPVTLEVAGGFAHDGVTGGRSARSSRAKPPATLTLSTCDPASALLVHAYADAAGIRLLAFPGRSRGSLDLLAQNKIHVGAIHFETSDTAGRNREIVRQTLGSGWVLLRLAWWESGVVTSSPTSPSRRLASYRWAMREPGSVAREVQERLIGQRPVQGGVVRSHWAVSEVVRSGWAEAGICLRLCAEENNLPFRPEQKEAVDLVFAEHRMEDRRLRDLIELIQSRSFRKTLSDLPGYSTHETGTLQFT